MNIQDCIEFTRVNPIAYMATEEDFQPHVRALGIWFADETGFYFQTSSAKEIPHQLELNPKTEICFYHHDGLIGTMLRITGSVEFLFDRSLKEKALNDRPYLKSFGLTVDSLSLVLFRIAHGQAHFWSMENNLKPKEIITF